MFGRSQLSRVSLPEVYGELKKECLVPVEFDQRNR